MVLRFSIFLAFLLFMGCSDYNYDNPTDPRNISFPDNITYGSLKDSRDNKQYRTVEIGSQTWMAENLNYYISGSYCGLNIDDGKGGIKDTLVAEGGYCDIYGRLYDWSTASAVCPSSWHLPSESEWNTLLKETNGTVCNYSYGESYPNGVRTIVSATCTHSNGGKVLKAKNGWGTNNNTYRGDDTYGFTAIPAGYGSTSSFSGIGTSGTWWTATQAEFDTTNFIYVNMTNSSSNFIINAKGIKSIYTSVRCVKD